MSIFVAVRAQRQNGSRYFPCVFEYNKKLRRGKGAKSLKTQMNESVSWVLKVAGH